MNSDRVRSQYENFPYPPVPKLALPRRDQGEGLRYENFSAEKSHAGIRILVAGCGTFEPLVVAQAHPRASEVVAVDLSQSSLDQVNSRYRLARLARPFRRKPPLNTIRADLLKWEPVRKFDYIIASNVLHHLPDPAAALARISAWLEPGGILRVVTYPKRSRVWMRATSRWLSAQGLHPTSRDLVRRAHEAVAKLPESSPVRSCFRSQPETGSAAGLVDAFFHACENPLSPREWKAASEAAGLELIGETQTETSRSDFLPEICPGTKSLSVWERLQILDDVLELCANPILWFRKTGDVKAANIVARSSPENFETDLAEGLRSAEEILVRAGLTLKDLRNALVEKVGPRVDRDGNPLPGLSAIDYDWDRLLKR